MHRQFPDHFVGRRIRIGRRQTQEHRVGLQIVGQFDRAQRRGEGSIQVFRLLIVLTRQEEVDPGTVQLEPTEFRGEAATSGAIEFTWAQTGLGRGEGDRAKAEPAGRSQRATRWKIENGDGNGGFEHVKSVRWITMTALIQIELRNAPIMLQAESLEDGRGADCLFRGMTRPENHPEHGALQALDYEAHEAMAIAQLEAIAAEVCEEHELLALRVVHALGRVGIGETSVLVEASSRHRDEAFQACRKMIDRLKERVPIFKTELWERGRTRPEGVTPSPERLG